MPLPKLLTKLKLEEKYVFVVIFLNVDNPNQPTSSNKGLKHSIDETTLKKVCH